MWDKYQVVKTDSGWAVQSAERSLGRYGVYETEQRAREIARKLNGARDWN